MVAIVFRCLDVLWLIYLTPYCWEIKLFLSTSNSAIDIVNIRDRFLGGHSWRRTYWGNGLQNFKAFDTNC